MVNACRAPRRAIPRQPSTAPLQTQLTCLLWALRAGRLQAQTLDRALQPGTLCWPPPCTGTPHMHLNKTEGCCALSSDERAGLHHVV